MSPPAGRIEFAYDAFGRRIAKEAKDGAVGFLWDGDVLLAEERGERSNEYILDIDGCAIPVKSIKKWDDGTKITEEERDRIEERIRLYFLKFQDGSHFTFF